MDMSLIRMRRNDKGIVAFCKSLRQFVAYRIGFLRCNLSRLKGLPDLISDHIIRGYPVISDVLTSVGIEFLVNDLWVALIGSYILTLFSFFSVLRNCFPNTCRSTPDR